MSEMVPCNDKNTASKRPHDNNEKLQQVDSQSSSPLAKGSKLGDNEKKTLAKQKAIAIYQKSKKRKQVQYSNKKSGNSKTSANINNRKVLTKHNLSESEEEIN